MVCRELHPRLPVGDKNGPDFRPPYADTSLYAVPGNVTNEQAIFLADSLPAGYEVGVLAGKSAPATPWLSWAPARSAWLPS